MAIQLFRIDDRLIHGQVVLGWAQNIGTKRILLCDDEVAENDWEKELYLTCVPSEIDALVLDSRGAASYLLNGKISNRKTIVLVRAPHVVIELFKMGYIPHEINLGGIHYAEDRRQYLPYIYLNQSEIEDLRTISDKGVPIFCQDLPTSKKYPLWEIVK